MSLIKLSRAVKSQTNSANSLLELIALLESNGWKVVNHDFDEGMDEVTFEKGDSAVYLQYGSTVW
jgi:hypothetical protein